MSDADVVYEPDYDDEVDPFDGDLFDEDLQQGVADMESDESQMTGDVEPERDRAFTVSRDMIQIIGYNVEEIEHLSEVAHKLLKTFAKPDRTGF